MSVGFECIDAHDALWAHYRIGKLGDQLQQILVTSALKKSLQVKSIQIRTRMYKDEESDCRNDINDGNTIKLRFRDQGETNKKQIIWIMIQ